MKSSTVAVLRFSFQDVRRRFRPLCDRDSGLLLPVPLLQAGEPPEQPTAAATTTATAASRSPAPLVNFVSFLFPSTFQTRVQWTSELSELG